MSLLESYTLRSSEQSVQVAIQAMVDMAKMDPETFHGKFEDNMCVFHISLLILKYKNQRSMHTKSIDTNNVMFYRVFSHFRNVENMHSVPQLAYHVS